MDFSNLVRVCEDAWRGIQYNHPEVPDVVVVVGSGGRGAINTLGHFSPKCWELEGSEIHEVLIVAEHLKRPAHEVFQTLLHESVHGLADVRKIKDVSGKRHNKKFALLCEEVGLIPPDKPDSRLGYSSAQLSVTAAELYEHDIQRIGEQLKLFRKLKLKEKDTKKTTWMAVCGCDRKIRLPKKTIVEPSTLQIVCTSCGTDFVLTEEDMDMFVEQHER